MTFAVRERGEPMRAIDADELKKKAFGKRGGLIHTADIDAMPTIQPYTCEGCEWEFAFGYGECHMCSRHYEDCYERRSDETD